MGVFEIILVALQALLSIALIGVVLFQSGKEAGLSGALAGNTETFMSKNNLGGWDKKLAAWTKWIALAWISLTVIITML